MKYLKLGILICGALGLVGMFMADLAVMMAERRGSTILMLAAFGLPAVVALIGLVRPPFEVWQAGIALACFVIALSRLRIWTVIEVITRMPTYWYLMLVGSALGVLASAIAVLRPERRR